jgi:hypothetical protein
MDDELKAAIAARPAIKVTPADIESSIASEHYFTAKDGIDMAEERSPDSMNPYAGDSDPSLAVLTFCVLVLQNGFTVTGESACASPENFDADIGKKVARNAAISKVWPLLGFRLRDKIAAEADRPTDQLDLI